jgi:hypothetical protein
MTVPLIGDALVLAFIGCCLASAALQIVAWSRHSRKGAPVNFRALWKPEEHFDTIGIYQIRLARRLLTVGGLAYLSYGLLLIASTVLQRAG